jgi:4-amino-4-deoxy-L-arabinose transferase-like glycosyltransferase
VRLPSRLAVARWTAPVAGAALALGLGLLLLDRRSLGPEEAENVLLARVPWRDLAADARTGEAAYAALAKPWLALVRDTDWTARLPAAVAPALAVALVVVLGTRLLGLACGVVAGVLLAAHLLVVSSSQQARGWTLALLAAVAATYLFARAAEPGARAWWWAAYALAGTVALAVQVLLGAVLAAHLVSAVVARPRPWWRPAAAFGVLGAAAVPLALAAATRERRQLEWSGPLEPARAWKTIEAFAGTSVLLLGLGLLGAGALWLRRRELAAWKGVLLLAWLVAPLGLAFALAAWKPLLEPRYLLPAAPALALLAALAVTSVPLRALGWAGLALVAGFAAFRVGEWYRGQAPADWRSAVSHVEGARAGAEVHVIPAAAAPAYAYYAGSPPAGGRPRGPVAWVVVRGGGGAETIVAARRLVPTPAYRLAEQRSFTGVAVQRWIRPAG